MKRFKNILVLYDRKIGDEAALDRAVALAKANDASLTLVEPIERTPGEVIALFGSLSGSAADIERRFIKEREESLERLAAGICRDGVDAHARILIGKPFLEVTRTVMRDGHDLVIMSADSWTGLRNIAFGSTSMHLMRKCPCPVWVMQPSAGRRFQRIIAAVDPSPAADTPSGLDTKIMQLATSLARRERCHLDVVHAWQFAREDLIASRSEITRNMMAELDTRYRAAHEKSVGRLLDAVDTQEVEMDVHLPKGDPAHIIPTMVRDRETDLIVMGTIGRTGISGLFIGNTAEDVLRQVDCSILALKPDEFVSPVSMADDAAA